MDPGLRQIEKLAGLFDVMIALPCEPPAIVLVTAAVVAG